ncbi:hypothetical protein VB636_00085, partial [Paracoccus sp. APAP_BH8]|uniref:hypothetical protein n=1 Tax=Paracoccus sp. APAP_BH8 TaxID=3110237 RepID=UPI002FD7B24C
MPPDRRNILSSHMTSLHIFRLLRRHLLGPAFMDQAGDVAKPDVLALHAQLQQHVEAGDAGRAA